MPRLLSVSEAQRSKAYQCTSVVLDGFELLRFVPPTNLALAY